MTMNVKTVFRFLVLTIAFHGCFCQGKSSASKLEESDGSNISAILESLTEGYDKRIRPNYWGEPVDVGVTLYILSITPESDDATDFTYDFYFRQYWKDPRLAFIGDNIDAISLSDDFSSQIWLPDTFFPNEKDSKSNEETTANEMIRLSSDGSVMRSVRLTTTAACSMDLEYFPMDSQLCGLEIESFGYATNHLRLYWLDEDQSIVLNPELEVSGFDILNISQKSETATTATGDYTRLEGEILFVRLSGYYVTHMYIPAALMVVISWVSLWLNRNDIRTRILLSVIILVAMVAMANVASASMPRVSYTKVIDVYFGVCVFMIFATVIEHAIVDYCTRRRSQNSQQKPSTDHGESSFLAITDDSYSGWWDLDIVSRVLFPVVFFVFNLIYFLTVCLGGYAEESSYEETY